MSLRRLTLGELALARTVFDNTIEYYKIWIHNGRYIPLQKKRTAMTPGNEMYYPDEVYSPDFSSQPTPGESQSVAAASHLFIHEMTHVWQYQRGYSVKLHGLMSWAANYYYDLNLDSLGDYSMEQQASIVSDYWLLIAYGLHSDQENVKYIGDIYESAEILLPRFKRVFGGFPRCVI